MADDPLLSSLNDDTLRNAQAIGDSMVEAGDAARRLNSELRVSSQLMVNYSTIYGTVKASASEVARIQDKAKVSAKAVNDATREQTKNLTAVRELNSKIEDLYRRARLETGTVKDQLLEQAKNLTQGRDNAQALADIYGGIAQDASKLNSKTAFFNALSGVVKDIPGLRMLSGPFEAAAKAARETVISNAKNNKSVSVLGAGMKAFAKNAAASAVSFFNTGGFIVAIVKGVQKLVKFLLSIDERAANLAKSLNMTKLEAASFDKAILRASGGIDYLNNRLGEAAELAAAFADNTGIISTNLRVFNADLGVINRRFGLSEQQTSEIAKNMLISGQSSTEFAVNALGAAEALEMQNGINLQSQVIMKDIADLSAVQFLNLNKQPDAIARAVTQARRFGLTMSTIEGIQGNLLNFSQSITDEINAELLLGKSLNLDRARAAALNNDYATVAAEISKEVGTAKDFTELNYIQQTALAKAVGMTRDELAKSLKEQEALEAAGFASAEAREKKYQDLRKRGLSEQQALKEIGMAEFTRQKQNISFQEKFNNLVHNLKMIFVQSLNQPLQQATTFLKDNPKFIQNAVDAFKDLALKVSDFVMKLFEADSPIRKAITGIKEFTTGIISAREEGKSFTDILKDGMGEFGNTVYRVGLVLDALLIKPIQAAVDLLQGSFKFIQAGGNILSGNFLKGIQQGKEGLEELNNAAANVLDVGTNLIVGVSGEGQANFFNKLAKGEINIDGTPTNLAKTASQEVKESYVEVDGIRYPSSTVNGTTTTQVVDETGASIYNPKKEEGTKPTSTVKSPTNKNESIEHTNWLLTRLIEAVERGGDVFIDGRKVGEALVLGHRSQ